MDAEVPTAEPDASDAFEEELCFEAPAVRTKKAPELPTQVEVAAHDALHGPYRSWCEICVAASGKEDPHTRTSLTWTQGFQCFHWTTNSSKAP